VDFVKMEGLGNDFVVVDGPVALDAATIRRWCDRRRGIGADGVLELTPVDEGRIRMRYWNADGLEAEMCGNGLRCLVRLAHDRGWIGGSRVVVETAAGDLPAELLEDGLIRALVGVPEVAGAPATIAGVTVHPVSVGNPHAVVFVDEPTAVPVAELGAQIETDDRFPNRANVEFVAVRGLDRIAMRVWERGVGETLASGTGATAAAYAAVQYRDVEDPVRVELPGGTLTIELEGEQAWMIGPATPVFTGRIEPGGAG
jgi:diaminopimelate epimerase